MTYNRTTERIVSWLRIKDFTMRGSKLPNPKDYPVGTTFYDTSTEKGWEIIDLGSGACWYAIMVRPDYWTEELEEERSETVMQRAMKFVQELEDDD